MPWPKACGDPAPLVDRVHSYIVYRLGAGPDADDATSETFARAVRYGSSYDPERGTPLAWLIGIARRCIEDSRRSDQIAPSDIEPSANELEERTVDRLELASALKNLGDRDRELIALRYGSDLDIDEIATHFSLSRNATDVALHRALRRLRNLIEPE